MGYLRFFVETCKVAISNTMESKIDGNHCWLQIHIFLSSMYFLVLLLLYKMRMSIFIIKLYISILVLIYCNYHGYLGLLLSEWAIYDNAIVFFYSRNSPLSIFIFTIFLIFLFLFSRFFCTRSCLLFSNSFLLTSVDSLGVHWFSRTLVGCSVFEQYGEYLHILKCMSLDWWQLDRTDSDIPHTMIACEQSDLS